MLGAVEHEWELLGIIKFTNVLFPVVWGMKAGAVIVFTGNLI